MTDPGSQSEDLTRPEEIIYVAFEQVRGPIRVSGGHGVLECFFQFSLLLEPGSRALAQVGDLERISSLEHVPQEIREQMMIAKPMMLIIQGNKEQIGILQPVQQHATI